MVERGLGHTVGMGERGVENDRHETEEERLDRKWGDLLQELRVMQTGAQLTAGFLLTLPFQQTFADLDRFQTGLYLALVILAAITTALVMGPVAVHRRLTGAHVKERVVQAAHWLVSGALTTISLLLIGMAVLIYDVVVDRTYALVVGAGVAVVVVLVLLVLPS